MESKMMWISAFCLTLVLMLSVSVATDYAIGSSVAIFFWGLCIMIITATERIEKKIEKLIKSK